MTERHDKLVSDLGYSNVQTFEVWSVSREGFAEIATQRQGMGPTDMEQYKPTVEDVFVRFADYQHIEQQLAVATTGLGAVIEAERRRSADETEPMLDRDIEGALTWLKGPWLAPDNRQQADNVLAEIERLRAALAYAINTDGGIKPDDYDYIAQLAASRR